MDALTAVTARTYENTLDFPRLARLGSVTDILEGYKADHVFRPDLWFFVHELPDRGGTSRDTAERGQDTAGGNSPTASDEPVGVLLLTSIPGRAELELTYLGLVEPARGRGHAMEMIAFARQIARREGAAFLLTSADARNIPAVKSYLRSGFRLIDRKTLYFRQG